MLIINIIYLCSLLILHSFYFSLLLFMEYLYMEIELFQLSITKPNWCGDLLTITEKKNQNITFV